MTLRHRFRLRILALLAVAFVPACGEVVTDPVDDELFACFEPSDCASYEGCVANENGDGVCITLCTLFDDSTCLPGDTCELTPAFAPADTMLTFCRPIGTVPTWEDCSPDDPCLPDHSCLDGTCVPHCDDARACDDPTQTCTLPPNYPVPNPTNAGACQ